ncbi:hypothetical protein FDN13_07135 [Caloramator sp. E03]|uniref:hypothetical protein n=1 Tax=Caloramator sp. E03 TaxID=2576307 RepID=UPI001110CC21|nr:hypothetical protein [Caloramator sp. E03]QCX33502.1 hypothetical protein FDN13_07135 [Caloramator sp. E03]
MKTAKNNMENEKHILKITIDDKEIYKSELPLMLHKTETDPKFTFAILPYKKETVLIINPKAKQAHELLEAMTKILKK